MKLLTQIKDKDSFHHPPQTLNTLLFFFFFFYKRLCGLKTKNQTKPCTLLFISLQKENIDLWLNFTLLPTTEIG